jgi:tetratricopeptide (TPR) repeat protein
MKNIKRIFPLVISLAMILSLNQISFTAIAEAYDNSPVVFANESKSYSYFDDLNIAAQIAFAQVYNGGDIKTIVSNTLQKYRDYITANPDSPYADDAQLIIGRYSHWLEDASYSQTELQKVIDNYPNGIIDDRTIAMLDLDMHDMHTVPSSAFAEYFISRIYDDINYYPSNLDYTKANNIISDVLSKYPNSSLCDALQYQIGNNYEQSNSYSNAISAYQKVIDNPHSQFYVYMSFNRIGSCISLQHNSPEMDNCANTLAQRYSPDDYYTECSFPDGNDSKIVVSSLLLPVKIDKGTFTDSQLTSIIDALDEWQTASNHQLNFSITYGVGSENLSANTDAIYIKGVSSSDLSGAKANGLTFSVGGFCTSMESQISLVNSLNDFTFYVTALHEIGHSLGLQHSFNRNDIMNFGGNYCGNGHLSQRDVNTLLKYCKLIKTKPALIVNAVNYAWSQPQQVNVDQAKQLLEQSGMQTVDLAYYIYLNEQIAMDQNHIDSYNSIQPSISAKDINNQYLVNNCITKSNVVVDISNALGVSVTKNHILINMPNDCIFTDEGTYIIYAGTGAKNTVYSFTIDKTAPVITVNPYTAAQTTSSIIVTATTNEGTLNSTSHTFTENRTFDFVATDDAGNVTTQSVTITNIDKTAPIVTGVQNNGYYNINKTITFNEGAATLDGNTFISGSTVSEEKNHTLIVTDLAGNSTKVIFSIDKTAPVITIIPYTTTPNASSVTVTATTNEGTLNTTTHTFTENGSFNFVATDAAGNVTTKTVTISNIAKYVKGDITGDGKVDALDLLQLKKYLLKQVSLSSNNMLAADVTGVGKVDALDLLQLKKYLLGQIKL